VCVYKAIESSCFNLLPEQGPSETGKVITRYFITFSKGSCNAILVEMSQRE
jgi:hypothetical protein